MDKPGSVLTQLYLQNQAEWTCRKGHGLRTPRLEQRKNESKKTGLSRNSLIMVKIKTEGKGIETFN